MLLTAGMSLVSEDKDSIESPTIEYHLMDYTYSEQNTTGNRGNILQEAPLEDASSDENCPSKSNLGDLRIYIEL